MTTNLIELGHWSTAEICEVDGRRMLIITNEQLESISLSIPDARALYGALHQFDLSGALLDD